MGAAFSDSPRTFKGAFFFGTAIIAQSLAPISARVTPFPFPYWKKGNTATGPVRETAERWAKPA
jgi:hypothetical protein